MNWWKKEKKEKEEEEKQALLCRNRGAMLLEDLIKCCDGKSNPIKFFSADMISKATNNFSNSNCILGFQSFYWELFLGINDHDRRILIKKYIARSYVDLDSDFGRKKSNKKLKKLVGCCSCYKDPLMVHNYGEKKQHSLIDLDLDFCRDVAISSMEYAIQNILIDEDGVAKLTDFSGCISIPQGKTFVTVDRVTGTIGFIDRDYGMNNTVSEKTDAYGFGFLMLLLITGGEPRLCKLAGDHGLNPKWVSKFIEEGRLVDEIADPKMLEIMVEVTEEERFRMNAFLSLSLRCCGCKGEVPTMVEVAKELKKIQSSSLNASSS